jgi:hypothetical protein
MTLEGGSDSFSFIWMKRGHLLVSIMADLALRFSTVPPESGLVRESFSAAGGCFHFVLATRTTLVILLNVGFVSGRAGCPGLLSRARF